MTKTQTTHQEHHVRENTPLNISRYTGFYLTLLILSTVGTAFGVFGLFGIPATIHQFELSAPYALLSLFNVLIILPVSILALVLLWLKRPLGIWLKLGTYAASIIGIVGLLLSADPIVKDITDQALAEVAKSNQSVSTSMVETITHFAFYASLGFALIVSVVFGFLWWFAWKKQVEADSE